MEKAPFKLTREYVDLMGGRRSTYFAKYRDYCAEAFIHIRKKWELIETLVEVMSLNSNYPAFKYNANALRDMKRRMHMDVRDEEVEQLMDRLIDQ